MMETKTLKTGCGCVTGEQHEGYAFFKGIPFAKTERFTPPVLVEQFDQGSFDATKQEKDCYQKDSFLDDSDDFYTHEFREGASFSFEEEYQRLNIVVPDGADHAPVLIFVHGGGFETGHIGETPYGYTAEYVKYGIVYVSIGYRLNVFGFYGGVNYGLMDQAASVDWLRKNIASFGGDPDNMVIMGQSAGAMSLMNQMCSEQMRGKIAGCIMQSGAGVIPAVARPAATEEAKPFWNLVREKAGASDDEELKKVSPEVLWKAWYELSRTKAAKLGNKQPTMDGNIPPAQQSVRMKEGKIIDVPMMFGITSQDMFPFMIYDMALQMGLKLQKQGHALCYGYFFDRTPPGNRYKAFHAADLWYTFGNMDHSWRPFEEADVKLKEEMISEIASFVIHKKPKNPKWTPITKADKGFRLFDGESDGQIYPAACRKKMWHTTIADHGPL